MSSQSSPDVPPDSGAGIQHQGGAVHAEVAVCTEGYCQGPGGAIQTVTLNKSKYLGSKSDALIILLKNMNTKTEKFVPL